MKKPTGLQPFIDLYLRNHVAQLSVAREMTGTIHKYFAPLLSTPLHELTPIQIEDWFHGIGATSPSMANKSLSILRTMFEKARDWRLFSGDNPCLRIKRYKEHSRKRFIQPDEMPRLMTVLKEQPEDIQCYFLLCLMVGCRRTEGLSMRWQDLDVVNSRWHKPHTKTDRAQTVPVPRALLQRIAALPRFPGIDFVFPAWGRRPMRDKNGHAGTSYVFHWWNVIRCAAGIPDVTIHDLRRTCASWLAIHGENLAVIGNVLNHTGLQHTAVYARLNESPVMRALEDNSARMLRTTPTGHRLTPPVTLRRSTSTEEREGWAEYPG